VGVSAERVPKVGRAAQGELDTVGRIQAGDVDLVINTVGSDPTAVRDSASIRRTALLRGVPYFTTSRRARGRGRDPRAPERVDRRALAPGDPSARVTASFAQ
jgi:hypothetical protein